MYIIGENVFEKKYGLVIIVIAGFLASEYFSGDISHHQCFLRFDAFSLILVKLN